MTENRPPKYAGVIKSKANKMQKPIGKIAIWDVVSDNPKSPAFIGNIQTNYGKAYIALWPFTKKEKII